MIPHGVVLQSDRAEEGVEGGLLPDGVLEFLGEPGGDFAMEADALVDFFAEPVVE